MARKRPPHIVENILAAGELVIARDGYAAASIAAIAKEAGIGVGSIYHYFVDRDALLKWVIIRALRPWLAAPTELPIGPPVMTITEAMEPYLNVERSLPVLHRIAAGPLQGAIEDELRALISEFCDVIELGGRMHTLVDACSDELEELRRLWYRDYRRLLVGAYEGYFRRRVEEGALASMGNPTFAARWLMDTVILFIRLRSLDHYPDELPTENLKAELVALLLGGLAGTR